MAEPMGRCSRCHTPTIHRCEHLPEGLSENAFICVEHRHAVHLACLLSGKTVDPRFLKDDQLLLALPDGNLRNTESLRS
mgnify:CR=1 FL=1